jgi:cytochrome c peroxidase
LSVNRNEACAFCHMPQTGFQGAIENLNLGRSHSPGRLEPGSAYTRRQAPPMPRSQRPGSTRTSPGKRNASIA